MSVEEVTTESWGSRLGGSFKGVITGGVLFLAGIPLLFWNEGRAVKTTKALEEGEAVCVSVPTVDTIDALNEGKLIHATGTAVTQDVLTDDLFGGISMKAMKLRREVEYYQWVENQSTREEKQVGGSVKKITTYTYSTKWVSEPVDSSQFKEAGHNNYVFYQGAEDKQQQAANASFGAFALTTAQIGRIGGEKPVELAEIQWPADLAGRTTVANNVLYIGAPVGYMPPMQPGMQPGMMNRMTPAPGMQPGVTPPGMVQTPATQPVPAERIMAQVDVVDGGFVTVPSIQPQRIGVYVIDGVSYILTPDGNATPVMPNGICYANNLHAITETVPGNGFVYYQGSRNPLYVNITNYGSLPLIKLQNKEFVRVPEGALVAVVSMNGARQAYINGAWLPATIGSTPQLPAPTYTGAVHPTPAVAMPGQPGAVAPGTVATTTPMGTANPSTPQVGDVRIKWTYVPDTMPVSIVSQQTGNTFSPYIAENGYDVDLLQVGTHNKQAMFQKAHDNNTMMTWILRFVGWLMMYMGLKMILKPISVLGDVLPILGNILEFGTGIIAFLVASVTALVVIAIAWLAYRPVIGITLLAIAIGLIVLIIMKKKKKAPVAAE
ncbi:MAG: TMEM43 family protein [Akkermansia sp.]|nr:TMEM43 family protein [Akkermansia sp.]